MNRRVSLTAVAASLLSVSAIAQPGTLDPTFGTGGKVLTDIGYGNDYMAAMVIQPDGRIVSAGHTEYLYSLWTCFTLMRHNPDGTLDQSFGGDGVVSSNLTTGQTTWDPGVGSRSEVKDLALLPDGRILAVGIAGSRLGIARYMPDGSLDETFGNNGWIIDEDMMVFQARVALMDDGRFVVASAHGFSDFHLARYNADGTRDLSLNGDGHVIHQVGPGSNEVRGIGVLSDDRVVVGGYFYNGSDRDLFLVRFAADGTLDATFNGTGEVTSSPGLYHDELRDMIVHADGSVLVAGTTVPTEWVTHWLLQRYLPDGTPDPGFGTGGTIVHEVSPDGGDLYSVAELSDGSFLVAGLRLTISSSQPVTAAFSSEGVLDAAYGAAGYCAFQFTPHVLYPTSVAIAADGSAAVAGWVSINGGNIEFDAGLASITASGSLNSSFNGSGKLVQDAGIGGDLGRAIALQPDGKLVLVSESRMGQTSMTVTRYHPDGTLDLTFGTGGHAAVSGDRPVCITLQPDGKILIGVDFAFALYRLNADGSLDLSFNGLGWVAIYDFIGSSNDGAVRRIAVQPDGKIVAAGYAGIWPGVEKAFALARFNPNGSLDPSFGGDGKVVTDFMWTSWEEIFDMTLMSDGRIVVTGYAESAQGFVAARYEPDGDLDPTFGGGDGLVNHSIGTGLWGRSKRLALRPNGRILLAGDAQYDADPFDHDVVLMQLLANGSLDAGFGTGGRVIQDIGATMQDITALALQPDGKALAAGYANFASTDDLLLLRFGTNGQLDNTFGSGGMVTTDFGPFVDRGSDMLVQPDGKAVVAGFAITQSDIDVAMARYDLGSIAGITEQLTQCGDLQVWPTPITPASVAQFKLAIPTKVTLEMLDANGRTVQTLLGARLLGAGEHIIPLTDAQSLAQGAYTLVLRTPAGTGRAKLVR